MEYRYNVGKHIKVVRVERDGDGYRISIDDGPSRDVTITRDDEHTVRLQIGSQQRRVHIARADQTRWVALGCDVFELKLMQRGTERQRASSESDAGSLQAQMPGQVILVAVQEGDEVTKGQTLVILEAMKMELRVQAPSAGRVKRVLVQQGQVVERGQQLVEVVSSQ